VGSATVERDASSQESAPLPRGTESVESAVSVDPVHAAKKRMSIAEA